MVRLVNYLKTKIPMILNTSFNKHGISTISSPKQAIEHLLNGSMNVLYLERYRMTVFDNRNKYDLLKSKIKSEQLLLKEQSKKWLSNAKKIMTNKSILKYQKNFYNRFNEKIS